MWRSPLPKGILGGPHLDHMIASTVPSSRDLLRSESVSPAKLNTRSAVALTAGIARNWRAITEIRGNRACPTSLHQASTSTSSLPTCLVRCLLCVQEIRSCRTNYTIRRYTKLECGRNTSKVRASYLLLVRKLDMEIPPDSLEAGGVNEL
jgi:hypothetical protein